MPAIPHLHSMSMVTQCQWFSRCLAGFCWRWYFRPASSSSRVSEPLSDRAVQVSDYDREGGLKVLKKIEEQRGEKLLDVQSIVNRQFCMVAECNALSFRSG